MNVKDAYQALGDRYEPVMGTSYLIAPGKFDAYFASLPPGSHVLDAGCGPGVESAAGVKAGLKMSGLDFTQAMVDQYRDRLPECEVTLGDMRKMPFADSSFDGLVSSCSLLHLPATEGREALAEMARVTKPETHSLIVTTTGGFEENHTREALTAEGVTSLYFHHWDEKALKQAIEAAGFLIEDWDELVLVAGRPAAVFIRVHNQK